MIIVGLIQYCLNIKQVVNSSKGQFNNNDDSPQEKREGDPHPCTRSLGWAETLHPILSTARDVVRGMMTNHAVQFDSGSYHVSSHSVWSFLSSFLVSRETYRPTAGVLTDFSHTHVIRKC